jgi:hypothetical protein
LPRAADCDAPQAATKRTKKNVAMLRMVNHLVYSSALSKIRAHATGCSILVAVAYAGAWLITNRLKFPIERDELHFWPTALRFSDTVVPSVALLRNYGELNTPLPFLVWGWLEHFFHGGIVIGRYFDFALSLAITFLIARAPRDHIASATYATLGLLAFPYYLGTSTHLYTDVIAAFFALLGVHFHFREKSIASCIAFVFGIAARQYIVAFPVALLMIALLDRLRAHTHDPLRIAAPLIACASLVGWIAFFGGLAPLAEIQAQAVATAAPSRIYLSHALFSLTTIGLYFVVPEQIFFRSTFDFRDWKGRAAVVAAVVLVIAFATAPPLRNDVGTATFGFADIVCCKLLPDGARVIVYYALALVTAWRFLREPRASFFVMANAAVMLKAHVAWEKYALPLLVVLWYLRSRDLLAGSPREIGAHRPSSTS